MPQNQSAAPPDGVGNRPVGPVGIVLLIIYFIALSTLIFYSLIQFLPEKTSSEAAAGGVPAMTYLYWNMTIPGEIRLFITVGLAGTLGSLVHALRSLYWYIGNRALVRSWIPKYVLMPFVGATLAIAFYFVIRGGFFSAGTNVNQTNPYGFTALGVLIGMFTEQAILKLKEVAETMLAKPHPGADAKPEGKTD
ncbi:MAG: hypothetical protein ABSB78_14295 [Bacteroidota bacterium]